MSFLKSFPFIKLIIGTALFGLAVMAAGLPFTALAQPTVGQPSPDQGQPEAEPASQGFLSILFSGGPIGVLLIVLLLALSVTAAYLVFEHIMSLRRNELMPRGLDEQVKQSLLSGKLDDAERICRERPSLLSFVLLHGLAEIDGGWSAVEKALEDAIAEQSARLFRKIEYLSVIGNIAPMVGLLGTVFGMIIAFREVAATQASAGAAQLAEGIYQALITTVGGLIVAIPSLGAFAIFRNRVDELVAEAAYMAQHVFAPLKRRRTQQQPAKSTPQPRTAPPSAPPKGKRQ